MPEPSAQAKDKGVIGLGVLITLASLIGAFALGDYTIHVIQNAGAEANMVKATGALTFDGTVAVGASQGKDLELSEAKLLSVNVKLKWVDEPNADSRHTNQPDTLELSVDSAFGSDKGQSDKGEVLLNFTAPDKKPWDSRDSTWNVTVTCVQAGDQTPVVPDPLGRRTIKDGGNAYTMDVTYIFLAKK